MRILYVEDNCELRDTIGLLMEGEGRTVVTCATAEEALTGIVVSGVQHLRANEACVLARAHEEGIHQMRVALRTVWQWMWDPKTQQGIRNLPAVLRSAVNKRQTGSDFDDDMLQRALPYLVNQLARVEV